MLDYLGIDSSQELGMYLNDWGATKPPKACLGSIGGLNLLKQEISKAKPISLDPKYSENRFASIPESLPNFRQRVLG